MGFQKRVKRKAFPFGTAKNVPRARDYLEVRREKPLTAPQLDEARAALRPFRKPVQPTARKKPRKRTS